MELGGIISHYRKAQGLTLDQLSEKSGVPKGTINKIIAGTTKAPTLENVRAIAHALGKTLDDFDMETKKSPAPEEPMTEDEEVMLFYKQMVAIGLVREGEDLTDRELKVLLGVLNILEATFTDRLDTSKRKVG